MKQKSIAMKKALLLIVLFVALFESICFAQEPSKTIWKVVFPSIKLDTTECITKIDVSISCARWYSIQNIPDDWIVEAGNPVSEVSTFVAEAGHGASAIWNSEVIRNLLLIRDPDSSCFSIRAKIEIENREKGTARVVKLKKQQIKLMPG